MQTEPIEDFTLSNERNLRIASAVFEAWPKARQKVVDGFLKRLSSKLKEELKDWEFLMDEAQFFEERWATFYFWKPAWEDQYEIGLQCHDFGEKIVFGVCREMDAKTKPFCDELLQTIKELHPSARTQTWWEARMSMHSPAADWRTPDVLWRMHTDDKFLNEVAEQLLEVAKASEKIIDGLIRKK